MKTFKNVDAYIKSYPKEIQTLLKEMRVIVQKAVPKAEESISYCMPAYKLYGKPVAYFGAQKTHIGFYPTSSPIAEFEKELALYKHSKGAVQFPFTKPIPRALMVKMIKYRVNQLKKLD